MLEEILSYNRKFVEEHHYKPYETSKYPDRKIAILTCMDTRLVELLPAALGGLVAWSACLLGLLITPNEAARYFLATLVLTLYAEVMARVRKAPATVFLVPGTIPMVPGGSLYYTMRHAVLGEWEDFFVQGLHTILLAGAIAGGVVCMMGLLHLGNRLLALKRR